MESKKVEIEIQQNADGRWLIFKDSKNRHAKINIDNTFCDSHITDSCVRQWAEDQFS